MYPVFFAIYLSSRYITVKYGINILHVTDTKFSYSTSQLYICKIFKITELFSTFDNF